MKLICPLSGIRYTATYGLGSGTAPHPVFYLPATTLLSDYLPAWVEGRIQDTETLHLLGCALLHKLPIQWETACTATPQTWARNLEKLAAVVATLDSTITENIPKYRILQHSASLENLDQYLIAVTGAIWEQSLPDGDEYVPEHLILEAEAELLANLRRTFDKTAQTSLPKQMADWAAMVGDFPAGEFTNSQGESVTIKSHWHNIIHATFSSSDYISLITSDITYADVDELVEHCETNITFTTLHGTVLLKKLRAVRDVLDEFKSPAPAHTITVEVADDLAATLLGESRSGAASHATTEETETNANTATASKETEALTEPRRCDYPSAAAYFAARIKFKTQQRGK